MSLTISLAAKIVLSPISAAATSGSSTISNTTSHKPMERELITTVLASSLTPRPAVSRSSLITPLTIREALVAVLVSVLPIPIAVVFTTFPASPRPSLTFSPSSVTIP